MHMPVPQTQEQSAVTVLVNPPISITADEVVDSSEEVAINTNSTSTSRDRLDALASMPDSRLEQLTPLAAMCEETARIELLTKRMLEPLLPVPPLAETPFVQSADRTSVNAVDELGTLRCPESLKRQCTGLRVRGHLYDTPDFAKPDLSWQELWTKLARDAKLREKQKWAIEQPKLDNAGRLRGIYFIDPEDKEFKETIRNARKNGNTNGSSHALQDMQEKQEWRDP